MSSNLVEYGIATGSSMPHLGPSRSPAPGGGLSRSSPTIELSVLALKSSQPVLMFSRSALNTAVRENSSPDSWPTILTRPATQSSFKNIFLFLLGVKSGRERAPPLPGRFPPFPLITAITCTPRPEGDAGLRRGRAAQIRLGLRGELKEGRRAPASAPSASLAGYA